MTNSSGDEQKPLDFERIRLKFTPDRPDCSSAGYSSPNRKISVATSNIRQKPPPLLPKPVLINSRNGIKPRDLSPSKNENERCDVKAAIRRFNNIGSRLFEPPTNIVAVDINNTLPRSSQSRDPSPTSTEATEQSRPHESISSDFSACSTDTETVYESRTIQRSLDFDESLGVVSPVQSDTLHKTILNEMRSNGLFKLSSNRAKDNNGLPTELGKMRETSRKTNRQPCVSEPPPFFGAEHRSLPHLHKATTKPNDVEPGGSASGEVFMRAQSSSFNARNTLSVDSSQSASTYYDYPSEREVELSALYNTGDEKEDKRLRDLHSIAREFYRMQKTYVDLLSHIGESYPKFIAEYSKRSGRLLLGGGPTDKLHVVTRISDHFKQILGVHRMLLDEFAEKYRKWDSRSPDLASVLQQKAEFLKICNSFLKEKRQLGEEMQQALDENKDLALATKRFEDNVLNGEDSASECGSVMSLHGISILMQLDSVHQNIVRYRLLMERYQKHLPAENPEMRITEEALHKLAIVSNTVNGFLAGADATQRLMPLYRKLGGVFDVFAPGRQLLHEGELQRQTRKELQLRYLILFSDMLLICRYASMGADGFDFTRLYKIPVERVRVQSEDHEDYEREFVIISPKKSSAFVARTKRERDIWVSRITEACRDYREKKRRRRLMALQKSETSQNNSCEDSPDVETKLFTSESHTKPEENNGNDAVAGTAFTALVSMSVGEPISVIQRNSQRYEALWIPDNKATKCLMMGCDTKFNVLRRKHHCRQCGWLICRHCVGYAPVKIKRYERVKVCPECYYEIKRQFEAGQLFPPSRIQRVSVDALLSTAFLANHQIDIGEVASPSTAYRPAEIHGFVSGSGSLMSEVCDSVDDRPLLSVDDPTLRIIYDGGLKYETPRDLFQPPPNGPLKKTLTPVQKQSEVYLASGKVYLRNRKGMDVLRWGRLTKEMFLQFYEAEFDDQPLESYFVYGYSLRTSDLDSGGCVIELIHRNQFQTDRKEEKVVFQVTHEKSAERWLSALRECISVFSDENPVYDD